MQDETTQEVDDAAADLDEQAAANAKSREAAAAEADDDVLVPERELAAGRAPVHGDGSPGEPETREQGLIRTGRAQPQHPADEDSAGLTPEATAERQAQTLDVRNETHRVVTGEGQAAGGDGTSSTGPEAPRGDGPTEPEMPHNQD